MKTIKTVWQFMQKKQPFKKSDRRALALALFLVVYLAAGIYTQARYMTRAPLPETLLTDFGHYSRALADTLTGRPTYGVSKIGQAYLYPPQALLVVHLFYHLPTPFTQTAVYLAVNLCLLGWVIFRLRHHPAVTTGRLVGLLALAFGFAPLFELLHMGQINLITLFGIALVVYFEEKRPTLAGFGLALAVITKVTPLVYFGYLGVRKRWKAILYGVGFIAMLSLLALALYGPASFNAYPAVFTRMLGETPTGLHAQGLFSRVQDFLGREEVRAVYLAWPDGLAGFVDHVWRFTEARLKLLQRGLTFYLGGLMVLAGLLAWRKRLPGKPLFILVTLAMTFSPNIMWYHHYIFMLLAVLLLLVWRRFQPKMTAWCLAGLLIVQLDRFLLPTGGLLVHLWAHLTLLWLAVWFIRAQAKYPHPPLAKTNEKT